MRFQTRMMFIFLLLFIATAALMLFFSLELQKKVVSAAQKDLQDVIHSVHNSTEKLSNEHGPDQQFLSKFISDAKANNAVKEITIIGSSNKVVASSNPHKVGRKQPVKNTSELSPVEFGQIDSVSPNNRYEVTVPIYRDKKKIGMLETSFIIHDLGSYVWKVFVKQAAAAIAGLFTLFLVSYIAFRRMNKPIDQLCRAADLVGSGDSSIHLDFKGSGEIQRLIDSFNSMAKKIGEQRNLEDDLREMERKAILSETAAVLAHEIRNPLNLINLSADHLMDEYAPKDVGPRKDYQEMMSNIKRETQRLNKMVTDFLAMGKPTKINRSSFTLGELVGEVELLLKHQMIETNSTLLLDIPPKCMIYADKEQMRLMLSNLILNAIQITKHNGKICVKAWTAGDELFVEVTDNGPGIQQEDLDKIFEPYFTKRPDGTGLGLALVNRIVQTHDGKITAENQREGGACFRISLPREPREVQHVENIDR